MSRPVPSGIGRGSLIKQAGRRLHNQISPEHGAWEVSPTITAPTLAMHGGDDTPVAKSSQVMFLSYFVELPDLDDAGLGTVWHGVDGGARGMIQEDSFQSAAPMEFRFVKTCDSALTGTHSSNPDAYFVNLDVIGRIKPTQASNYPAALRHFFADVARDRVATGGTRLYSKQQLPC